jgi:hypothetical protein
MNRAYRLKNITKRAFAGLAGGCLLVFSALLPAAILSIALPAPKVHAESDWPLTWYLDSVTFHGEPEQSLYYSDTKIRITNRFGQDFAEYSITDENLGETKTSYISWEVPERISVCFENESPVTVYVRSEEHYESLSNLHISYDVIMAEDGYQISWGETGGWSYSTKDSYSRKEWTGSGTFKYLTIPNRSVTLPIWHNCWIKNGALRSEDDVMETYPKMRMRIIVDPWETLDPNHPEAENGYVLFSYKLDLGDVTYLEPSTATPEEEEEEKWVEDEDYVAASSSEGMDEGNVIQDEIVEGEGEDEDEERQEQEESRDESSSSASDNYGILYVPPSTGKNDETIDKKSLPKSIGIGTAGAVAATAAVVAGSISASKDGNETDKKKKEEKKKQRKYRMYVSKDFGNTLNPGDPPLKVTAKIMQIISGSNETYRGDLTSKIDGFSSDKTLIVSPGSDPAGKAFMISVPEGSTASQGTLSLRFVGEGGAYTKHVIFKIANPEIKLAQDAIAFIAEGKKTATIGFAVKGLGSNPQFSVSCQEGTEKNFKLSDVKAIEQGIWGIDITEIGKDKKYPGYFEQFEVEITATNPEPAVAKDGKKPVSLKASEKFYIVRFQEGIRVIMEDLKAYLVVKGTESVTQKENPKLGEDDMATPAHSRVEITTFTWDEEEKTLTNPVPEKVEIFIEDIPDGEADVEAVTRGQTDVCKKLDFQYQLVEVMGNNNTVLAEVFQTSYNVLMPPARAQAKVSVEVTWHGKVLKDEKKVTVITMPRRELGTPEQYAATLKEDKKQIEDISHMLKRLYAMDTAYEMRPLIHRMELIVDGYDENFGLYMPEYYECKRLFARYVYGEIGSRRQVEDISTYDYFWDEGIDRTLEDWEKSQLSFGARLTLGIVTFGASELYLTPRDAVVEWTKTIKKFADESDRTNSALKNFTVGAAEGGWIMLRNYAWGKAGEYIVVPSIKFGAVVLRENAKEAGKYLSKAIPKLNKFYSRLTYKAGLEKSGKILSQMEKRAAEKASKRMEKAAEYLETNKGLLLKDKDYQKYMQEGKTLVEEYAKSLKDPNITEEAQRILCERIQCHKGAMSYLNSEDVSNAVRARFNLDQSILKERTLLDVQKELAKEFDTAPSSFKTFKATASSAAGQKKGLSSSIDHDFTFTDIRTGEDVPSKITQRIYADKYYERVYGTKAPNRKAADELMKAADQTAVHKLDRESYGADIDQIMDPKLSNKPYKDIERVVDTTQYKTDEWLANAREHGGGRGLGETQEAGRQTMKADKKVISKVKELIAEGRLSEKDLPMDDVEKIMESNALFKQSFAHERGKLGQLVELETALKNNGSSIADEVRRVTAVMRRIQEIQLNYRTNSEKLIDTFNTLKGQIDSAAENLNLVFNSLPAEEQEVMKEAISELRNLQAAGVGNTLQRFTPEEEKFYENQNMVPEKVAEWLSSERRLSLPKVEVIYAKGRSTKLPPKEKIESVLAADEIIHRIYDGRDGEDIGDTLELAEALAADGKTIMEAINESEQVRSAINSLVE